MIEPDNFKTDPYGYLTNQLGHIGLGVLLVFLISRGCFELVGEYPIRLHVWLITGAFYLFVAELAVQGWRGWDTIEDTIFTVFYGAGAPLWAFKEVTPGDAALAASLPALDMFFAAAGLHLLVGVLLRAFSKYAALRK